MNFGPAPPNEVPYADTYITGGSTGSGGQDHHFLLLIVIAEVAILVGARKLFRKSHGG